MSDLIKTRLSTTSAQPLVLPEDTSGATTKSNGGPDGDKFSLKDALAGLVLFGASLGAAAEAPKPSTLGVPSSSSFSVSRGPAITAQRLESNVPFGSPLHQSVEDLGKSIAQNDLSTFCTTLAEVRRLAANEFPGVHIGALTAAGEHQMATRLLLGLAAQSPNPAFLKRLLSEGGGLTVQDIAAALAMTAGNTNGQVAAGNFDALLRVGGKAALKSTDVFAVYTSLASWVPEVASVEAWQVIMGRFLEKGLDPVREFDNRVPLVELASVSPK